MPKLFFIGDTHGDLRSIQNMIDEAVDEGCYEAIQVGDFGFWWPGEEDRTGYLSSYLVAKGIKLRFVDGNHDMHARLFKLKRDSERHGLGPEYDNFAPNVIYQHRGSLHQYEDGTRIVFLGGAPSIDYRGRTEGVSWWKEELITDQDMNAACAHVNTKIDILVTHDSATPPPGIKETSDMTFNYRAAESQFKLRWVMDTLKPDLNVHGHYHFRYSGRYKNTQVEGLDCNLGKQPSMYYIYESKAPS